MSVRMYFPSWPRQQLQRNSRSFWKWYMYYVFRGEALSLLNLNWKTVPQTLNSFHFVCLSPDSIICTLFGDNCSLQTERQKRCAGRQEVSVVIKLRLFVSCPRHLNRMVESSGFCWESRINSPPPVTIIISLFPIHSNIQPSGCFNNWTFSLYPCGFFRVSQLEILLHLL